jgi:hypothetical protein
MDNGVSPRAIQQVMGHGSLETTMRYLHAESLSVRSPLETIMGGLQPGRKPDSGSACPNTGTSP